MLQAYRESNITFLRAPVLEGIPGVVHAFSTRRADSDDLSFDEGGATTDSSRDRFMSAAGMAGWPLARLHQVHSNVVYSVRDNGFVNEPPDGDALHTGLGGLALGIATADCVPVLIADRSASVASGIHAGWRGTSEGVVRKAVDALLTHHGVTAQDLRVAIGPHIRVCCMEVGEEVVEWFQDPDLFEWREEWEKPHLNLAAANLKQLAGAGVPTDNVEVSSLCTFCRRDLFHSYRRDGDTAGRMLSVIGIEP